MAIQCRCHGATATVPRAQLGEVLRLPAQVSTTATGSRDRVGVEPVLFGSVSVPVPVHLDGWIGVVGTRWLGDGCGLLSGLDIGESMRIHIFGSRLVGRQKLTVDPC